MTRKHTTNTNRKPCSARLQTSLLWMTAPLPSAASTEALPVRCTRWTTIPPPSDAPLTASTCPTTCSQTRKRGCCQMAPTRHCISRCMWLHTCTYIPASRRAADTKQGAGHVARRRQPMAPGRCCYQMSPVPQAILSSSMALSLAAGLYQFRRRPQLQSALPPHHANEPHSRCDWRRTCWCVCNDDDDDDDDDVALTCTKASHRRKKTNIQFVRILYAMLLRAQGWQLLGNCAPLASTWWCWRGEIASVAECTL